MTLGSRAQVCGELRLSIHGEDVSRGVPAGQATTLLTYLIIHRDRPVDRDSLSAALWSDDEPPSVDRVIAALLSRIRAAIGRDVLPTRGEPQIVLPEPAIVDLEAARRAVHTADAAIAASDWRGAWLAARIALYTSERHLLPGVDLPWVDAERDGLRDIQWRAWEALGEAGLGLGGAELVSSRRAGRELMRNEPLRESGYRLAMRVAAAQGNDAEAIHIYHGLRRRLADDLGIDPGTETRTLFERIVTGTRA